MEIPALIKAGIILFHSLPDSSSQYRYGKMDRGPEVGGKMEMDLQRRFLVSPSHDEPAIIHEDDSVSFQSKMEGLLWIPLD